MTILINLPWPSRRRRSAESTDRRAISGVRAFAVPYSALRRTRA
jgi:hypothetical protein